MIFHRLMWTNFVYYFLAIRLFLSSSVNLTSHFSNFAEFRQLQIPNARMKYYEIWPAYTKTPHNTTHKIANLYFESKYHFLTLQKTFRLLLNKGVHFHKSPVPKLIFHSRLDVILYEGGMITCLLALAAEWIPTMGGLFHDVDASGEPGTPESQRRPSPPTVIASILTTRPNTVILGRLKTRKKIHPPLSILQVQSYSAYQATQTLLFSSPLIWLRCITEIKFAQNFRWLGNWHYNRHSQHIVYRIESWMEFLGPVVAKLH